MIRRNYTDEVGLASGTPRVPLPLAIVLLVGIAAAFWFGMTKLDSVSSTAKSTEAPVATSPQAAGAIRH